MKLRTMIYSSLFAAMVAALGLLPPIITPLTPVPITAQTLGVMLAGSILGAKRGGLSLVVFVFLVAVGAPLLAGGRGGLGVLFGVTGGYVLAWPVAAFVTGLLVEKFWNRMNVGYFILFNVIGGILVIYASGITYLSIYTGTPWGAAAYSALIFIPGDLIKVVLASLIATQMSRVYPMIQKDRSTFTSKAA